MWQVKLGRFMNPSIQAWSFSFGPGAILLDVEARMERQAPYVGTEEPARGARACRITDARPYGDMRHRALGIVAAWSLAAVFLVLLSGCTTVPETGRAQFNVFTSDQEMQLGLNSFEKMKQEVRISNDPTMNALVQKVGRRIAAVAPMPNAQWEFVVFDRNEANAFCLPGGKVGVYSGIFTITRDEAGMATVIGHEVAHAVARHGGERMTQSAAVQLVGELAEAQIFSRTDPRTHQLAALLYGVGKQVGIMLPYSRSHESEADRMGLRFMARAGYDPEAAVKFWERFAEYNRQSGGSRTPEFLRTHPLDEKRIRQIKEWLPEAKAQFRAQP
jgi:predicted Zn-dependent protease